jgi:hypothetical protein
MMVTSENVESLLAIDIGSVNTRVFLFDVAGGSFRFLASGIAPTTAGSAFDNNLSLGISQAINRLGEITGRVLRNQDSQVIVPTQPDGSGVDALVTTISAGTAIQIVILGLLPDISLESAQRLASSSYTRVIECIGLTDRRNLELQIEAIIRAQPEIILVAGGTEGGASRSVMKLMDLINFACNLGGSNNQPQVLYAGNQALNEKIRTLIEPLTTTWIAPNIRPSISLEDLNPAQEVLGEAIVKLRTNQFLGLGNLSADGIKNIQLNANAFGRIVKFLSQAYDNTKGVLGVDLGGSITTVAGAREGKLSLYVANSLGIGEGMVGIESKASIDEIVGWLPLPISAEYVRDYIYNKPFHPASIPATVDDLAIEQAVARKLIREAMRLANLHYPTLSYNSTSGLKAPFEPILAGGAILTQAPTYGQALLMLLDGLQPRGITTFVLDQNNMAAVLGAAASINSIMPVQILESGAFLDLGTVITPISQAKVGTPILKIRLINQDESENVYEIKQGTLSILPIPSGQKARLYLEPMHNTDIGMKRPGAGGKLNVVGGALGVVVDARGRPLMLPNDPTRRQELIKKWLWTLGG